MRGVGTLLDLLGGAPVDIPAVPGPGPGTADEVDRGVRQGRHADRGLGLLQRLRLILGDLLEDRMGPIDVVVAADEGRMERCIGPGCTNRKGNGTDRVLLESRGAQALRDVAQPTSTE